MYLLAGSQPYLSLNGLSICCLESLSGLDHHPYLVRLIVMNDQYLAVWTLLEVGSLQPQMIWCHSRVYFPSIGFLLDQQISIVDLHKEVNRDLDQRWTGS